MTWVARVLREQANSLAGLRGFEVEVASDSVHLWLRGTELSAELELGLRCAPGIELFTLVEDRWLVRRGEHVPRGAMTALHWEPLRAFFRPRLPLAPLPGRPASRLELKLVRSTAEERCSALLLAHADWAAWCVRAPLVRLERLEFAASADGRVYVRGLPLPPLAGAAYVEHDRLAVPAGWRMDPPVSWARVAARLELNAGDVAVFGPDGVERIPAEAFVRATRTAARASASESTGG